jgi:lysozyme
MMHEHLVKNVLFTLEDHEGFKDKPYRDSVGVLTFGHGLTYITRGESLMVAKSRLVTEYLPRLRMIFPDLDSLSPARQEVLLNMMYNLGPNRLATFKKMIASVKAKDFDKACFEMLNSKWADQVGKRAVDLAEKMRRG